MKILVLAGGYSPERNVSLSSGAMVASALRRRGHQVALIDSYIGVDDTCSLEQLYMEEIPTEWTNISSEVPDLKALKAAHPACGNALVGPNVLKLCQEADVVFLGLHGGCGEDGRLPAALDLLGVHYTGSDYLSSGIAMNKHMTKVVARAAGVPVPDWDYRVVADEAEARRIAEAVAVPVVIKVPDSGSSIGVYIARTKEEAYEAMVANPGTPLIFEQFIAGREIQMAFLQERALPSIEIIVGEDFYNYENKYQKGRAYEKTPADITCEQEEEMGRLLLLVAKALNLSVYSRADFIIDGEGKLWFIEINTLPGMTQTSLMPQEAAAAGISFEELCELICLEALKNRVGTEA